MGILESIKEIVNNVGNTEDKLIEVLIKTQQISDNNYISEEALRIISKELNIPLSRVYGVATFYSMLSTKKRGKYVIQICNSAPCYINGGKNIVKTFENILGIKMGETTEDGLFSLEFTSCIGACDIAPAIKINDDLYGNLDYEKVVELINDIRKEEM